MRSCESSDGAWLSSVALASLTVNHLIQRTTGAFKLSNFPLRKRAPDLCQLRKIGAKSQQSESASDVRIRLKQNR